MTKNIFIVGGNKGGVGKSIASVGLIDTLLRKSEKVMLVESDNANPDVFMMYGSQISSVKIDLDDANGWIDLVNTCDENADSHVVVNTGARNNKGIAAYSATLAMTLPELNRKLITLWVINRQRDSLELLREYMAALPSSVVHVVRNGHYGDERKFELYNNSNIRKAVEAEGGKSVTLPDLADRVSDDLYSKRLSIDSAMQALPIGNRAELTRWREEINRVLGDLVEC